MNLSAFLNMIVSIPEGHTAERVETRSRLGYFSYQVANTKLNNCVLWR
ncbi:MAG: hypothetical protein GDA52_10320 [Rhodobacteraceae bacterium]|nr:hypothetical protein [Paracoccaceae bacterium]